MIEKKEFASLSHAVQKALSLMKEEYEGKKTFLSYFSFEVGLSPQIYIAFMFSLIRSLIFDLNA
jgi:hypothetical protein